ncbi:MAG: hypothetical protein NZM37_10655, partial [Sandaracinaceae bacterium]|nr:hypothetical protein [Sandaracinaceae bacterium]
MRRVRGLLQESPWVPPTSYEWFLRGELAMARGWYEEGMKAYGMARTGSEDVLLLARHAEAAWKAGRKDLSQALIAQGLAQSPEAAELHMLQGRIALADGNLEAARSAFEKAHTSNPHSFEAVEALCKVNQSMGKGEENLTLIEAFVSDHPPQVQALKAFFEYALHQKRSDKISLATMRILRHAPWLMGWLIHKAKEVLEAGDPRSANAILRWVPIGDAPSELELRLRVAQVVGDAEFCELLASRAGTDALEPLLRAAECWLAVGQSERALEMVLAAR